MFIHAKVPFITQFFGKILNSWCQGNINGIPALILEVCSARRSFYYFNFLTLIWPMAFISSL
ncbi:hypothetical protein NEOC95_002034 [Neochlamydia sp. AcF95]|nr:hypothetical protein [Neochlamydia sp. AcF95]